MSLFFFFLSSPLPFRRLPAACTVSDVGRRSALLHPLRSGPGRYNLGLLWRLTGDGRFAERATRELLHVTTRCTTWDPWGLALAEMTHAVG